MSLEITDELNARQTPEEQAIIRLLLAHIAEQDRRIAELEAEVRQLRKTPQNSSLPPSAQHPHAKPKPKKKARSKRKRGGQRGRNVFAQVTAAVQAHFAGTPCPSLLPGA